MWSMPTGGGKSWILWLWALLKDELCMILEPTKAVMNNHVAQLKQLGLPAAALHSGNSTEERTQIKEQINNGNLRILYGSAEVFRVRSIIEPILKQKPGGAAIDELHTPYLNDLRTAAGQFRGAVNAIRKNYNKHFQLIGCSATLTPNCLEELGKIFNYEWEIDQFGSLNRPNLNFKISGFKNNRNRIEYLKTKMKEHQNNDEITLIYVTTTTQADELADELRTYGATAYHGKMADDLRQMIEKNYQDDQIPILVATEAYGMGVNKANIAAVYEANSPRNILQWAQHAGRAGRNGEPAQCELLYCKEDFKTHQQLTDANLDQLSVSYMKKVYNTLIQYIEGDIYHQKKGQEFYFDKKNFYRNFLSKVSENEHWQEINRIDFVLNQLMRKNVLNMHGEIIEIDPIPDSQLCGEIHTILSERYQIEVALMQQMKDFIELALSSELEMDQSFEQTEKRIDKPIVSTVMSDRKIIKSLGESLDEQKQRLEKIYKMPWHKIIP